MKRRFFLSVGISLLLPGWACFGEPEVLRIFPSEAADDKIVSIGESRVTASIPDEESGVLVQGGHPVDRAGVIFEAPEGGWDLSPYRYLMIDVLNVGDFQLRVRGGVSDSDDPRETRFEGRVDINPGEGGTIWMRLRRYKPAWVKVDLSGMVSYPWNGSPSAEKGSPGGIEAGRISGIHVYTRGVKEHLFQVTGIRAGGRYEPVELEQLAHPESFFPFIDAYGQYIHQDWEGKIHSDEDLRENREREAADLSKHPAPVGWNRYGGWANGPRLEATGWFRTAKYNGKWWLVDPEGCLFISMGINEIVPRALTPVGGSRQGWFQDFPDDDSVYGQFIRKGSGATPFAASAREEDRLVDLDIGGLNLFRKYGPEWMEVVPGLIHQRLRSWGFNTIANWSDPRIIEAGRTPYTRNIHIRFKPLEASKGYWSKFPDVFDEEFDRNLETAVGRVTSRSGNDPWCIGYFVGNEMDWGGNVVHLAMDTLSCPPHQAAKQAFIKDLKAHYKNINALNEVWGTGHSSWEALLEHTLPPDSVRAYKDLTAFHRKTSETYFRKIRDAIRKAAPNQLFLGSRIAGGNPVSNDAATRYCDVVSFNFYGPSVETFDLPFPADVPLLIGEFSFWSSDHGSFNGAGSNLDLLSSQEERARAFTEYVRSILAHPQFVGCHWFKYQDQPLTGRGLDGENFQFGLIDITDSPYPQMIKASRTLADTMYAYRLSGYSW